MIPEQQSPRRRPYVLLPPTAVPAAGRNFAARQKPVGSDPMIQVQVSLQEAGSSVQPLREVAAAGKRPTSFVAALFLYVVVPSALGAAAGFYLAGQRAGDLLNWSIAGGAAGLVLGGVCLLWNRRKG